MKIDKNLIDTIRALQEGFPPDIDLTLALEKHTEDYKKLELYMINVAFPAIAT